jgi:hypothetical protein
MQYTNMHTVHTMHTHVGCGVVDVGGGGDTFSNFFC